MKKTSIYFLLFYVALSAFLCEVWAQKFQPAGEDWIEYWYGMDLVKNNGGFNASAKIDWLAEGTNKKLKDAEVTTPGGLRKLKSLKSVKLPKNGGDLKWDVIKINTNDDKNMSTSHGEGDLSNIEWYGLIVIKSKSARTTKIHPAHDDYAHIWLNGEKVFDNSQWTGGARIVKNPTKVKLKKGDNILLFRCGESGGADYVNLHFEKTDSDLKILPTTDKKFFQHVQALAVKAENKLATIWAEVKTYR